MINGACGRRAWTAVIEDVTLASWILCLSRGVSAEDDLAGSADDHRLRRGSGNPRLVYPGARRASDEARTGVPTS